jgi:hypothetical protein
MRVKKIALALREAKEAVRNIALFNSMMDTAMVIMIGLLVTKLLSISWWIALIPAAVYFPIHAMACIKDATYKNIESKFPELNEALRTAADNWKEDNEIVNALSDEVLEKMKHIKTGRFLEMGKLMRQISIMGLIAFIIVGASAFDVHFLDFPQIVDDIKEYKPFQDYDVDTTLFELEEGENLSDILGDASILELGTEQLDLSMNPIGSDSQIGTFKDVESRTFREVPPREIRASTDASFEDSIPKQYQKIVKTYFRQITK